MKNEIQSAIAAYESDDKDDCLEKVRALIRQFSLAQEFSAEIEVRQVDATSGRQKFSPNHTVQHYLILAEQRLLKETCDSTEIAFVPVLTCLNTALQELNP
jgi:hypothetical protein